MELVSLKKVFHYLYSKLTGSFMGFVVGSAAAGLTSHFFETRSLKNLWGLTAKKRVIDSQTLNFIEWWISLLIGFVVFEIITKGTFKKIKPYISKTKIKFYKWLIRNEYHLKMKSFFTTYVKKDPFLTFMRTGLKINASHACGKINKSQ